MTSLYHIGVIVGIFVVYTFVTFLLGMIMSFGDADTIVPWAWLHGAIAFMILTILYLQQVGGW